MESLELTIIHNLIYNEEYFNKVIPYLKTACFKEKAIRFVVAAILSVYHIAGEHPTPELVIAKTVEKDKSAELAKAVDDIIKAIKEPPREQPLDTLLSVTEKYFQQVFTEQVLTELLERKDHNLDVNLSDVIKLRDAVSFTMEEKPFYDYAASIEERTQHYVESKDKFEFPLAALNDCTNGGMRRKSLSVVMASTGGGKSIFLSNAAAFSVQKGLHVLYITCEMSVEEISKRIDANLLDITQDALTNAGTPEGVDANTITQKFNGLKDREKWGHLYIKEYPAGVATALDLQRDIDELERINNHKIDILVVDYLNLMATSRYSTKNANTYTIVKAIAEELRGVGQEKDIPILTATQSNRSALSKENRVDGGLETVSDSIGLPQTADFMFNIIDVLDPVWRQNRWRLLKVLKNRWGDPSKEYIKVALDTRFAKFSNVDDWKVGVAEKPTLCESALTKDVETPKILKESTGTEKTSPTLDNPTLKDLF